MRWSKRPSRAIELQEWDAEANSFMLAEIAQVREEAQALRAETRTFVREIKKLAADLHDVAAEIQAKADERDLS